MSSESTDDREILDYTTRADPPSTYWLDAIVGSVVPGMLVVGALYTKDLWWVAFAVLFLTIPTGLTRESHILKPLARRHWELEKRVAHLERELRVAQSQ